MMKSIYIIAAFICTTTVNFEASNPQATIINKTSRGTVYNMQLDNTAVLVPDMKVVGLMPVQGGYGTENMPNPLMKY